MLYQTILFLFQIISFPNVRCYVHLSYTHKIHRRHIGRLLYRDRITTFHFGNTISRDRLSASMLKAFAIHAEICSPRSALICPSCLIGRVCFQLDWLHSLLEIANKWQMKAKRALIGDDGKFIRGKEPRLTCVKITRKYWRIAIGMV